MFYLINKHSWLTSFWVIHFLRKKFAVKKAGHTWTLDPLATWLLLIATWNSTKLIPYLEKTNKTYIFSFNIDWHSPTWDLEWEIEYIPNDILEEKKKNINIELIENVLKNKFIWKIKQIPPKYSAIKIDWKKAYNLVREWKEFEMKQREIEIFEYKLISYNFPEIIIEMTVSAWTYIRTIAEDIGKELWLNWYITKLHRSKIDFLEENISKNLDDISINDNLDEKFLFPEFSYIELDDLKTEKLLNWMEISLPELINWKKYFIKNNWKTISLVEIINWKTKILINWL